MCLLTTWCTIVSFLLRGTLAETQQKPFFNSDDVQANLGLERRKIVVLIMTDDQDAVMNSDAYMPRLKEHIIDQGTFFSNHFTTTAQPYVVRREFPYGPGNSLTMPTSQM